MHWPSTPAEAIAVQEELRGLVETGDVDERPRYVAGLDVAYDGDRLAAAVVVLDWETLAEVDQAVVLGETTFPYVPGLFAFREVPGLVDALGRLRTTPDLLVCDGQGLAHPRRFGIACHLGVILEIPAVGCAKSILVGRAAEPGPEPGAWTPLVDRGETVGAALRTRARVKPVYVSIGHRVSLETAIDLTLRCGRGYRLPEPTRLADRAASARGDI
jgi:deoxyribonuclease V